LRLSFCYKGLDCLTLAQTLEASQRTRAAVNAANGFAGCAPTLSQWSARASSTMSALGWVRG
jgi:hypothetical protein